MCPSIGMEALTRRLPTSILDRVLEAGHGSYEVVFRVVSKSGPPKIEIIDPISKTAEKISYP